MSPATRPKGGGVVVLGRVAGVFGTRGWIKVLSYGRERTDILRYPRWQVGSPAAWSEYSLIEGRSHGKGIIARLQGLSDPNTARSLVGADIGVRREDLPAPEAGSHYWIDLEGLRVVNLAGVDLGRVSHLFETGANDVMVVAGDRERLIPFIKTVVHEVDLDGGLVRVDWDAGF